jgi:hypothetical protein
LVLSNNNPAHFIYDSSDLAFWIKLHIRVGRGRRKLAVHFLNFLQVRFVIFIQLKLTCFVLEYLFRRQILVFITWPLLKVFTRESKSESRALVLTTLHFDGTAQLFSNITADAKTEPITLVVANLSRAFEEGLEQVLLIFFRDAAPEVLNLNNDELALLLRVEMLLNQNDYTLEVGTELNSVGEQVNEHLLHTSLVQLDQDLPRRQTMLDRNTAKLGLPVHDLYHFDHCLIQFV